MLIAVWETAINILTETFLIAVSSDSSLQTKINILVEIYLIAVSSDFSLQTTINILEEIYLIAVSSNSKCLCMFLCSNVSVYMSL